jgi:hypothetical protein
MKRQAIVCKYEPSRLVSTSTKNDIQASGKYFLCFVKSCAVAKFESDYAASSSLSRSETSRQNSASFLTLSQIRFNFFPTSGN